MSIRNNNDRINPRDLNQDTPLNHEQTEEAATNEAPRSSPMTFSAPTEFVDLPSEGKFYFEGHPLHGVSSVEIKFMTAKEEDILTSKSLLKKNLTIDRLLRSIILNKNINPDDLLVGDKNAIIVASRITGYGSEYTTNVACPACNASNQCTIDLENSLENDFKGKKYDDEDVEATEHGSFIITTPRTKAKVEIRLLNGHDEKRLAKLEQQRVKNKLPESLATTTMGSFIMSVNGSTDPHYIGSFIENAPAADARYVREAYRTIAPNINMGFDFYCQSCGHEQVLEVPLNAEFFWPK
jgi:hypothetical protein